MTFNRAYLLGLTIALAVLAVVLAVHNNSGAWSLHQLGGAVCALSETCR